MSMHALISPRPGIPGRNMPVPPLAPVAHMPLQARPLPHHPAGLRPVESQRIESGAWFAGLSAGLRAAILAEARDPRADERGGEAQRVRIDIGHG